MRFKKSMSLLLVLMMSLNVLIVPVYAEQGSGFFITSFNDLKDNVKTQYIVDEDQFSDLVLPDELTAMGYTTSGDNQSAIDLEEEPQEVTFYNVNWEYIHKSQNESGRNSSSLQNSYVFAPVLTGSCILAEGVELPEVTAVIQPMMTMSLMSTLGSGTFVVPGTASELANHLLAENSDITISGNATSTGVLTASSMFDSINLGTMTVEGKDTSFSLPPGILVTSGTGTPPEENTSENYSVTSSELSDSDVEEQADIEYSNDAFSLKFDFTVPEDIPAVSFLFMFGSEEYPDFVDSEYVDGAAIIVDGVNYAEFEGGIPLKVVSDAALYENIVLDNGNSVLNIEYNGISAPKVINALLDKTRTTHTLKIVIADTSDTSYDSGLFISAMKTSRSETGGIIENNDASLISVAEVNDNTPGEQSGEEPQNAVEWDINVPSDKDTITIDDISVTPLADFELYSDSQFTLKLTGDESIPLVQGDIVCAYVKVKAADGVTEKYYAVNIIRDLGTIDLNDIIVIPYSDEYDGENHSISVSDTNGGTVTYSTSEDGEYTTEKPSYINVGNYTVYYKVDRGSNYYVLTGSSTVEITKADIAIQDIAVTPYSDEYDGENHSISVYDINGGIVTYSTSEDGEYTTDNPAYKNIGSYTVYYKVDRGTNYNILSGSAIVEISKINIAPEDITVTPYSGEYDGASHSIAVVDANGGTVTYSTNEDGEYTTYNPAYENTGSYTVYYKVDRGTSYNVLIGSANVEITKKDIDEEDITVTPYSGEYDGENHSISVVDADGGIITYSASETGGYATENPVYKDAGNYTVYYKVDRGANYNVLIGSANVEITKKDIDEEDITVTPYSGEYDGENHSISVVDADGGNVTYSTSETGEYTTGNPAYKNAGSYTVYYKVDRGLNYNVLKGSSTVEIIKLNIAAEDITVIPYNDEYDGESHSISASDANEGTITYSTSEDGEYTADNPAYKNAGSYTVYYKVDRGTNYNVLKGSSTVEIDFREVTLKGITITDKTYDGTADATSNVTGAYLDGVIEGDDVVLDSSDMTAMFNDENVNNDKPVSISGYALSGEKASQYNLIQPEGITGNIISETSSDMNISIDRVVAEETDYNGEWTGSNVTITLRGDAPSGIEKYQYTTDGGLNWADFTDAFLLIEETTDKIYAFRAISNGGINSDSSDTVTVKIDKVKPVIQSIEGNPATPKNTSQIITFEIFEENSGIDSSTLTVSKDGANIEIKHEDGKYSFIADANGKYDINVSDNAGNAADTEAVEVNKLDFEKPVISSLIPANNAQQVDTGLLTAIFNEDVMKATDGIDGDITIFNSNGAVLERINIKNNRIKASENQVDIYLTKPLKPGTEYYVTIDSGIIYDIAGNSFAGIADSAVWRFRTSNANINNSIIGINVSVIGEQYKAIVDPSDETVYSVTAKPYEDGLVKVKITPVFLKNAEAVITTEDAGVEVDGNIVTITDIDREIANVKIQVKNADGSIDENKIYTLIIHRGSLETKVTKSGMSVDAVADNLRGAVDVSSDISDGKQMELELEIADNGNIVSESQKLEIENFLEGQSVAMYLEIDLKLKNITNDTETLIENTQNPVKIKIEIPENMRGGRDYKVIRVHKGVIEILDTVLEGNYLVFETDRFSQYAISYKIYNEKDESDNSNQVVEKHIAYIKGYEDETFRPENNITRAEAATIIARLSPAYDELKYYINVYGDVDAQAWYANTVSFGAQNKLILGYEDGSFRPDSSITRAELVSIIARFNNIDPKDESELRFEDASGHWAEGNISALYKLGWINGYEDGSFRPDAAITRAEAVKIINASLGRTPVKERVDLNISKYFVRFTDISVNHWAYYDILESSITHAVEDFN